MVDTRPTEEILTAHPKWRYDRTDRNGTRYFNDYTCDRCGGQGGSHAWAYTGFTCYKCGGTGKMDKPSVTKVYTPEHAAKLEAQRNARHAKAETEKNARLIATYEERMLKEGFQKEGEEYVLYRVKSETFSIKEQLKELGCRFKPQIGWYSSQKLEDYDCQRMTAEQLLESAAPLINWKTMDECHAEFEAEEDESEWVGTVGARIEVTLHIDRVMTFSGKFGANNIILMSDENGNKYKWSTQKSYEEGEDVTFKATIKEHAEYTDKAGITTKQTVLTRCTLI